MTQKEIYSVFTECKKYTLDPYYHDLLTQCSQNRFPKGIRMVDSNSLLLTVGSERKLYNLPTDNIRQTWLIILSIFREKLQLHSEEEFVLEPKEINKSRKRNLSMIKNSEWKDLKGKKIKDQLLLEYVKFLKTHFSLSIEDARKLKKQINLHFNILRDVTGNDIIFQRGQIKDIVPLEIVRKNNKIFFNFNCRGLPKIERISSVSNKSFSVYVEKYLKNISENCTTLN